MFNDIIAQLVELSEIAGLFEAIAIQLHLTELILCKDLNLCDTSLQAIKSAIQQYEAVLHALLVQHLRSFRGYPQEHQIKIKKLHDQILKFHETHIERIVNNLSFDEYSKP